MPEELLGRRHGGIELRVAVVTTSYKINALRQPLLRLQRPQQTVHHPHKLCLQEPEQEPKLQPQLCRSGAPIPRPRPATTGHPTAISRPPPDTK
jgi:hypothetical protein